MEETSKSGLQHLRDVLPSATLTKIEELLFDPQRKKDYSRWYVDWLMADIFQGALIRKKRRSDLLTFRTGILDRNITKQFRNVANTEANVERYNDKGVPNHSWQRSVKAGVIAVRKMIGIHPRSLVPMILSEKFDLDRIFSNRTASAGVIAPKQKKKDCYEETLRVALILKHQIATRKVSNVVTLPAIEYHRAQISNFMVDGKVDSSGIKLKDRSVWGLDAATVAIEGQYARPLIEALSHNFMQYAGGKSNTFLSHLIYTYGVGKYWCSTDISQFDQHVQAWHIHLAFDLIRDLFPESCKAELDWVEHNFINTSIICFDGQIRRKNKGVPSGSYFTQVVGSICNLIMMCSFLASQKKTSSIDMKVSHIFDELRPCRCGKMKYAPVYVMGDDNLVFTRTKFKIEEYAQYSKRVFGLDVKPEKSASGLVEPPEFLKRTWLRNGETRDAIEFFLQVCHPEYERNYEKLKYSPWHIIYGLYVTYKPMMAQYFTEKEIIQGMLASTTGLKPLLTLGLDSRQSVPGSIRSMTETQRRNLYNRASWLARSLAA